MAPQSHKGTWSRTWTLVRPPKRHRGAEKVAHEISQYFFFSRAAYPNAHNFVSYRSQQIKAEGFCYQWVNPPKISVTPTIGSQKSKDGVQEAHSSFFSLMKVPNLSRFQCQRTSMADVFFVPQSLTSFQTSPVLSTFALPLAPGLRSFREYSSKARNSAVQHGRIATPKCASKCSASSPKRLHPNRRNQ